MVLDAFMVKVALIAILLSTAIIRFLYELEAVVIIIY